MNALILFSFRNLIRQKRRNILLGSALTFGVMVLTIAFAFSNGITDTLLNRTIVYMAGHIKVNIYEQGRFMAPIIRDKEAMITLIRSKIPDIKSIDEGLTTYCRAVGNNKSDIISIVGTPLTTDFKSYYKAIEGSYDNFNAWHNPVIVSEEKAKLLNLKVGDQLKIRFDNINSQKQSAIFTVAVIVKSQNMFMDYATFADQEIIKSILGFQAHETGSLKIILKHPKKAIFYADKLHRAATAHKIHFDAILASESIHIIPLTASMNSQINSYFTDLMPLSTTPNFEKTTCIMSQELAKKNGLTPNTEITIQIQPKYPPTTTVEIPLKPTHLATYHNALPTNAMFVDLDTFFKNYNYYLPITTSKLETIITLKPESTFWQSVPDSWVILSRTKTTEELYKKYSLLSTYKTHQPVLDIASMYETASYVTKMELVFNGVMVVLAIILLMIIMTGVLNSLTMTIRERTKEIGTLRAMGMRQNEVKKLFLLEILWLSLISWAIGTLCAILAMKGLNLIQFKPDNPFSVLLVDHRLFFLPTLWHYGINLLFVLVFTLFSAYWPARRAAKVDPAQALRHN